jgi:glycosyltransferase involved in cell wall biosynthesis
MKILFVHNYYQNSGGEDVVVANERALLINRGHDVALYTDDNHRITSGLDKLKTASSLYSSNASYQKLNAIVKVFKPEVIHAHNLFPLITAATYDVAFENRIPVVQTLHNYRTVCASGLLFRDNKPCELCIKNSPYYAALHKCYRGSLLGSLAVAQMINKHRRLKTWSEKIDHFIALTEFAKEKLVSANFPSEKITVKPNFTIVRQKQAENLPKNSVIFVGRVSQEKGIQTLIDAWMIKRSMPLPRLKIIGDGPLLKSLVHKCRDNKNISFLGQQPEVVVTQEMETAKFLVFPSICYEGFPMVIVEALEKGLPVLCSDLGSMTSIIEDGVTGLYFKPNNPLDLSEKSNFLSKNEELLNVMGENCKRMYVRKYTPEKNYQALMSIYSGVIENY